MEQHACQISNPGRVGHWRTQTKVAKTNEVLRQQAMILSIPQGSCKAHKLPPQLENEL